MFHEHTQPPVPQPQLIHLKSTITAICTVGPNEYNLQKLFANIIFSLYIKEKFHFPLAYTQKNNVLTKQIGRFPGLLE